MYVDFADEFTGALWRHKQPAREHKAHVTE